MHICAALFQLYSRLLVSQLFCRLLYKYHALQYYRAVILLEKR